VSRVNVSACEGVYLYTHMYILKYRARKDHKLLLQNYITTHFGNPCYNNFRAQKRQHKNESTWNANALFI